MGIDREHVQRWLDAYVGAWETYDHDRIVALFSPDAEYRWHPWDHGDDLAVGPEAIAAAWLAPAAVDPRGTYEGRYEPVAVHGDAAVDRRTNQYFTSSSR